MCRDQYLIKTIGFTLNLVYCRSSFSLSFSFLCDFLPIVRTRCDDYLDGARNLICEPEPET